MRQLGLGDSISIIMGIMIGSGIFLMAGSIARQLHSIAMVIAVWTLGGLMSLAGALSISELGAAFPSAGGLYVYLEEAYGSAVGFLYGWSAIVLIYSNSVAAMAAAIGFYAAPLLGLGAGWQKGLQVLCIVFFTAVNSLGVSTGKRVQNTLTALKIGGLAAMMVVLYVKGSAAHFGRNFFGPAHAGFSLTAIGVALVAVLWAYDGWHIVSFTAGEIRNPARTLPRALLLGVVLTTIIYLLANVAYYAVLSPGAIRGTDRVAALAVQHALGAKGGLLISILIIVSILGAINGVMMGAPRVNLAMARDGLFFRPFARVSRKSHAPVLATVAQGAFAMLFTTLGSFRELFTSYVFTSWIFYGLCVAAVILLRYRRPALERPYRCPLYPITPAFFLLAACGVVVTNFVVNFRQALLGVGLILLGLPLYFLFRYMERNRRPA
ncbi:amino acid permease [Acidobacterium sp.]|uniref:APC family permease n=1 Tax=Acidobacterium sp. TaxID=1872119 RepID=UPI003390501A